MAKSTKRKTEDAATTGPDFSPTPLANGAGSAPDSDIARRAYDRYLARGREHGHDLEDWLQAERALRGPVRSAAS
jgi:hypothetical protein